MRWRLLCLRPPTFNDKAQEIDLIWMHCARDWFPNKRSVLLARGSLLSFVSTCPLQRSISLLRRSPRWNYQLHKSTRYIGAIIPFDVLAHFTRNKKMFWHIFARYMWATDKTSSVSTMCQKCPVRKKFSDSTFLLFVKKSMTADSYGSALKTTGSHPQTTSRPLFSDKTTKLFLACAETLICFKKKKPRKSQTRAHRSKTLSRVRYNCNKLQLVKLKQTVLPQRDKIEALFLVGNCFRVLAKGSAAGHAPCCHLTSLLQVNCLLSFTQFVFNHFDPPRQNGMVT